VSLSSSLGDAGNPGDTGCPGGPDAPGDRTRLRRSDATALLAGLAALTLWLSLTDGIYRYLRPTMRPWLVASGVFLAGLALAAAITTWRERRAGGHSATPRASVVGWLLVLPLVVAVSTDPGALGAFAVRQQVGSYTPNRDFDLDSYLRSHTSAGQVPALQVHQFLAAAGGDDADRALLAGTPVRLTGFVVRDDGSRGGGRPGRFTLARLMIGCCAGDATGLVVTVAGHDGDPPDEDTWVEVTGTFDEELTAQQPQDAIAGAVPVLAMTSMRAVDEPREPYEYPG
jgi:uncharacterized repeat protein (TIGR03943 family)